MFALHYTDPAGVSDLATQWVWFNKNFKNYHRIAQVIQNVTNNGEMQTWNSVPWPLADELRKNYGSDFTNIVMASNIGDHLLALDDKKLKKQGGFFEKLPCSFPALSSADHALKKRLGCFLSSEILDLAEGAGRTEMTWS